jgi:ubiquinone/menaquinone biosynthesis C-methylase UbiE
MSFKDHFSGHAGDYRRFRPDYPPELFVWLAQQAPAPQQAWDCATGSGQAACALAQHFAHVIATDASAQQIENAHACDKVSYAVASAEASGLEPDSIDLVTVAQALHWFDLPRFYAEATRVLRPGGLVAAWTYNLFRLDPEVDALVDRLYAETLGGYWPFERRLVEQGYRDLPFPFVPLASPVFHMTTQWSLEHLLGYLGTWSAVRRYREMRRADPVAAIASQLAAAWGDEPQREVRWPLALRVGRV